MTEANKPAECGHSDSIEFDERPDYQDPDILRRLHLDEELSQKEIGDRLGCSQGTVSYWMQEHGIETRRQSQSITISTFPNGRQQLHVPDGDGDYYRFYRHHLVALLCTDDDGTWEYDWDEVLDDTSERWGETVVHHKMGSPVVVDIPENLAVVSRSDHVAGHATGEIATSYDLVDVLNEVFEDRQETPDVVRKTYFLPEMAEGCADE